MNTLLKIIISITVLVLLGIVFFSFSKKPQDQNNTTNEIPVEQEENIVDEEEMPPISLPLASMQESGDFGPFGCGQYLNFHTVEVPKTSAVLNAVYTQLFTLPYEVSGTEDKNIIAYQQNLDFDSVTITNGNANLYLSGSVMGNHCGDEVFRHQIEQSAFQFDTVSSITVFVNNEIFD